MPTLTPEQLTPQNYNQTMGIGGTSTLKDFSIAAAKGDPNAGAILSAPNYKPVSMLSTSGGADALDKKQAQFKTMEEGRMATSGTITDPKTGAVTAAQQNVGGMTLAYDKSGNERYVPVGSTPEQYGFTAEKPENVATFIDPNTGAEYTNPDQNLVKAKGLEFMSGVSPSWMTQTGEQSQLERENNALTEELNGFRSELDSFKATSDAYTQEVLGTIEKQFAARKMQMEDINRRRVGSLQTTGTRTGGERYTASFGGIISEEERQGWSRLVELDAQEREAVAAAKQAQTSKNWEIFSAKMDLVTKLQTNKQKEIEEFNKKVVEQNKRIDEEAKNAREEEKAAREQETYDAENFADSLLGQFSVQELSQFNLEDYDMADLEQFSQMQGVSMPALVGSINRRKNEILKDKFASMKGDFAELSILKAMEPDTYGDMTIDEYVNLKNPMLGIDTALKQSQINENNSQIAKNNREASQVGGGIYDLLDFRTANAVQKEADQFDASPTVKRFNNILDSRNAIAQIPANTKNPADHQAIIYYFAKALDPDSVVREGEYATIKKYAQPIFSRYKGELDNALNGTGFLSDAAVTNIKETIENRHKSTLPAYNNLEKETKSSINKIAGKDVSGMVMKDYKGGYDSGASSNATEGDQVSVISPDGTQGTIPASQLDEALAEGYTQA